MAKIYADNIGCPPCSTRAYYSYQQKHPEVMLTCPNCNQDVSLSVYRNHMFRVHKYNSRRTCPWCLKPFRKGETTRTSFPHLYKCMRKIKKSQDLYFKNEPYCDDSFPAFDMMGRTHFANIPELYEPFVCKWLDTVPKLNEITFKPESGLTETVLQALYARLQYPDYGWYHAYIRAVIFPTFLEAMQKDTIHILPFSCLCDESHHKVNIREHDHHRHCIVVSEDDSFEKAMAGIKFTKRAQEKCKNYKKIKNVLHLINTIAYVGQPKNNKHYYIQQPVFGHASFALSLLYEGGFDNYMEYFNRKRDMSDWHIEFQSDKYRNKKMVVKISDLITPNLFNCVMPVDTYWEPMGLQKSNSSKAMFLFNDGYILPFRKNHLGSEWLKKQIEGGNVMLSGVKDLYYKLNKTQRTIKRDSFKSIANMKAELNGKDACIAYLTNQVDDLKQCLMDANHAEAEWKRLYLEKDKQLQAKDTQFCLKCNEIQNILEKRYSELEKRYSKLEKRYSKLEKRYTELQTRYTELDARYTNLQRDYQIPAK